MKPEELRALLPATEDCHYLNYAATAPMLKTAAEAMHAVVHQGLEPLAGHFEEWLALLESGRRAVADLVHASPEEIAFTTNTSTALSLVAGAIRWQPGDRVLYPADEFPSNRFVWDNLADLGVRAEAIEPDPELTLADQLAAMDLSSVRLVAFSAVSYRDGRCVDVARVTSLCHARNILVAVDGIQAVGAVPVDVRKWGCDFLACGGQKWLLGPVGSGFLYVAHERLCDLRVPLVGWASSRSAGEHDSPTLEFVDGARRFEPGLPDIAAIAGLTAGIQTLGQVGWANIFDRIRARADRVIDRLQAGGLDPLRCAPSSGQSGIVAIRLQDAQAEALATACKEKRVIVAHRTRELRISVHATTTDADIDVLLALLATLGEPRGRPTASSNGATHVHWKLALVTGASRGLGEGIARALARRGCDVTLVGRDRRAIEAAAARLRQEFDVAVDAVALNLSDQSAVEEWLEGALPAYDVLVNNAACAEAEMFMRSNPQRLRNALETNFLAPALLAQRLLPGMVGRGQGAILNVVTSGARCALPLFSEYAASKGALWALSESLQRELDGTGVTVTTFVPPHMETATRRRLGRKALSYFKVGKVGAPAAPAAHVGEKAVEALAAGRRTVVPLATRLQSALNALLPDLVASKIQRSWRGVRSAKTRRETASSVRPG